MNGVRSNWSKQNFPIQNVWAAQQILPKIILTFDFGYGETIYTFNLYDLPTEARWQCTEAHTKQLASLPWTTETLSSPRVTNTQ